MKTIEQAALEAIDQIRPSYAEAIREYGDSKSPEIVAAREVMESRRKHDAEIIAGAIRETIDKLEYCHKRELEAAACLIERLLRYANRVAERHPKAVTINGQYARTDAGIWLAKYNRTKANHEHQSDNP